MPTTVHADYNTKLLTKVTEYGESKIK